MISPKPWSVSDKAIYIRDKDGQQVCLLGPFSTVEDANLIAAAPTVIEDVRLVLKGFDDAVFVRNIMDDDKPGWAIRCLPYIAALSRLARAAEAK